MLVTINLDDALFAEATAVAAESGTTTTAIIEDALRIELLRRRAQHRPRVEPPDRPRDHTRIELLTSPGGLFPGVNLDSTSELLDLMDGIES